MGSLICTVSLLQSILTMAYVASLTVTSQLLSDGLKPAHATKWADFEDCVIEVEQNPWDGMGESINALQYDLLDAFEQEFEVENDAEDIGDHEGEVLTTPPGVMPVILPAGHVVEVLEAKPAGMKWGLSVVDYNGALLIVNIKEEGYWHSVLGSKYVGWHIHKVGSKVGPKPMKDILKDDINHCLRFQLGGQPLPAPPPPLPLPIEVQDDKVQAEVSQQRLPSQLPPLIEVHDDNVQTEVDDIGDVRCLDDDLHNVEWFNSRFTFCKCCYKWHRRFAIDGHVYRQAEDMEDYQELLESASLDVRDIFHGLAKDGIVLPDYAMAEVNSIEYNVFTSKRLRLAKVEDQLWWKAVALAIMMPATRFYGYNMKHP